MATKLKVADFDLNFFYDENQPEASNLICRPSIYGVTKDGRTCRIYLSEIKLNSVQTKSIAPHFPEEEWGADFFIGLELFKLLAAGRHPSVDELFAELPDPNTIDLDSDERVLWQY